MLDRLNKTGEDAPSKQDMPEFEEYMPRDKYRDAATGLGGMTGAVGAGAGSMLADTLGKMPKGKKGLVTGAAIPFLGGATGALVGRYGLGSDSQYEKKRKEYGKAIEDPTSRTNMMRAYKARQQQKEGSQSMSNPMLQKLTKEGGGEEMGPTETIGKMVSPTLTTYRDKRSKGLEQNAQDFATRRNHQESKGFLNGLKGGLAGGAAGVASDLIRAKGVPRYPIGTVLGAGLGLGTGSLYGAYKGTQSGEKAIDRKYENMEQSKEGSQSEKNVWEEYFEEMAPAKEAMRQIDRGVSVKKVTEKLASADCIGEEEAKYLQALGEKTASLRDAIISGESIDQAKKASLSKTASTEESLSKEAKGMIRRGLSEAGQFARDNRGALQAAAVGIPAAAIAGDSIARVVRSAADPLIEQYRYNKMQNLPGKPVHKQVKGQIGGRGQNSNLPAQYGIPIKEDGEEISPDERHRRASRKAFEIVHKNAPELTSQPEAARSFLKSEMINEPHDLMERSLQQVRDRVKQRKERQKMFAGRQKRMGAAAGQMGQAVKDVSDAAGSDPTQRAYKEEAGRQMARKMRGE